ncbi:coenzyme A pyrophosphatase [Rhodococcoides trifolii]|uniref:Coenzyme A pyrophosphatase n=1 Tax=Rhodococcoides trifolii TaxID=908250 RepID=A0A917LFM3_9NOCA|nr:CoA pyrophosphatase [Rhodococcus trifolii]GGG19085.1 coenzyme A pyrophosphatase [Rhodococcus trifolii]
MTAPAWLRGLEHASLVDRSHTNPVLDRQAPEGATSRDAAVLVLFSGSDADDVPEDADVLLTQRASSLRQHSGQVAFPGGAADPGDDGPIGTALREAVEETGLDPSGVEPLATLDPIYVPPSGFVVTPVVAFWRTPSRIGVVDTAETERVVRVKLSELLDPARRFVVRHPLGYQGPAFGVDEMLVWGFTAGILSGVFDSMGWGTPWNTDDIRDLDASIEAAGAGMQQ